MFTTPLKKDGEEVAACTWALASPPGFANCRAPQSIVPPALPWPLALVYVSGFFEVLGGIGLLSGRTRRPAAWGLLALLVAVYPANIHMLVNEVYLEGMPRERWLLWARMPLQFVFAAWVAWVAGIWPARRG